MGNDFEMDNEFKNYSVSVRVGLTNGTVDVVNAGIFQCRSSVLATIQGVRTVRQSYDDAGIPFDFIIEGDVKEVSTIESMLEKSKRDAANEWDTPFVMNSPSGKYRVAFKLGEFSGTVRVLADNYQAAKDKMGLFLVALGNAWDMDGDIECECVIQVDKDVVFTNPEDRVGIGNINGVETIQSLGKLNYQEAAELLGEIDKDD